MAPRDLAVRHRRLQSHVCRPRVRAGLDCVPRVLRAPPSPRERAPSRRRPGAGARAPREGAWILPGQRVRATPPRPLALPDWPPRARPSPVRGAPPRVPRERGGEGEPRGRAAQARPCLGGAPAPRGRGSRDARLQASMGLSRRRVRAARTHHGGGRGVRRGASFRRREASSRAAPAEHRVPGVSYRDRRHADGDPRLQASHPPAGRVVRWPGGERGKRGLRAPPAIRGDAAAAGPERWRPDGGAGARPAHLGADDRGAAQRARRGYPVRADGVPPARAPAAVDVDRAEAESPRRPSPRRSALVAPRGAARSDGRGAPDGIGPRGVARRGGPTRRRIRRAARRRARACRAAPARAACAPSAPSGRAIP